MRATGTLLELLLHDGISGIAAAVGSARLLRLRLGKFRRTHGVTTLVDGANPEAVLGAVVSLLCADRARLAAQRAKHADLMPLAPALCCSKLATPLPRGATSRVLVLCTRKPMLPAMLEDLGDLVLAAIHFVVCGGSGRATTRSGALDAGRREHRPCRWTVPGQLEVLARLAAELLDVVILGAEALRLRLNAVVRTESLDVEHLGEVCRRNIAAHLAAAGLAADLPDRELGLSATTCSGSLLTRAPVSGQLGGVILDALESLRELPPEPPDAMRACCMYAHIVSES